MPSAHGPHHFIMERQKAMNSVSSTQYGGDPCTFICTECGEGFTHYAQVLAHMTIHGPLESFSFDGSSNGFEVPREYVLQENGTLAVLNGYSVSLSPVKPPSPGVQPTITPAAKPLSPDPKPQSIPEPIIPKPLDLKNAKKNHPQVDYRCEICSKSFNSLQSLHCHHQYRNTEQNYRCTLCCKIFEGRQALETHLHEHARDRFHSCRYCGKRFIKAFALVAHQKENHTTVTVGNSENNEENKLPKMYSCRKCKLNFFWMSDFQTHAQHYCKGKASNATFAAENEVNSKDNDDGRHENCYSNGNFTDLKNGDERSNKMTSNVGTTHSATPYRCGLCGDCFSNLTTLKEHHRTHRLNQEIITQKPKIAIKARRRRAKNTNGKLFPCKLCHRVFNHSSSLSRHMRYHKGTMHKCKFCGRHFSQRCDLTRHLNMNHTAEMEKKPGSKHLLLRTERQNLINKSTAPKVERNGKRTKKAGRFNYKCQECGKRFGLAYVYRRHLRHHKRCRNKCPICPAKFISASLLKVHIRNHPSGWEKTDVEQSSRATDTSGKTVKGHADNVEDDDLVGHTPNEKGNSNVVYECTECIETFSSLEMFLQHQTSHGTENKV
ncbi:zinc finger protein 43 [Corythoichthys intestinalis]|uniref:zinc finger protein 43 n=1 Tax=Corythoichthys intestinalis TaxID=161448 RepID=UPI0025A61DA1|nr:zinc finger protein 43 [Corythoichthys intestinalis]